MRTLRNLRTVDLGFAAERIVQARVSPQTSGYKAGNYRELYRHLLGDLNSTPGIPFRQPVGQRLPDRELAHLLHCGGGYTHQATEDREVQTLSVTPGYFETMGVPLADGP